MKLVRPCLGNLLIVLLSLSLAYVAVDFIVLRTDLAGGVGLTALLIDEVGIRFLPTMRPYGDCKVNRTHLSPSCDILAGGDKAWIPPFRIAINQAGFRDREYPLEKDDHTFRVAALGDSFTFGTGVDNDEAYPHVLEEMLNRDSSYWNFEVLNLGLPGGATDTEFLVLSRYQDYEFDLVILQTLSNDLKECTISREAGSPHYDDAPSPQGMERCACVNYYLYRVLNLTEGNEIPLLLYHVADNPDLDICLGPGEGYLYLRAGDFLGKRRYQVSRMDRHPNSEGHARIAQELVPMVEAIANATVR